MAADTPAITLEELIALNDEIISLVRAGVPLEGALSKLGEDLPGRLGRITQMLAERMKRGESLVHILESEPEHFPPVYRAVLLAGLKGGRLPAALESVSFSARRLAETRQLTIVGFAYPLMVVVLAWLLFAFFSACVSPGLYRYFTDFRIAGRDLFGVLAGWADWAWLWGPLGPAVIVLLAALWWSRSARASVLQPRSSVHLLGWLPWLGRMLRTVRLATFAETLSLLVENRVPLPEGLVLSAEATGDPRLIRHAKQIADAIQRGAPPPYREGRRDGFPPLLGWLMITGQGRGAMLPALRHASDYYRRQARDQGDLARLVLPVMVTLVVGGGVTLTYALLLFAPWAGALRAMAGL